MGVSVGGGYGFGGGCGFIVGTEPRLRIKGSVSATGFVW